ncbi:MAG TPA: hypothetical protein PLJ65_11465, partial [Casimicrobium sp.]|nr:hypothetical protein [Casimicrobium sp.]
MISEFPAFGRILFGHQNRAIADVVEIGLLKGMVIRKREELTIDTGALQSLCKLPRIGNASDHGGPRAGKRTQLRTTAGFDQRVGIVYTSPRDVMVTHLVTRLWHPPR